MIRRQELSRSSPRILRKYPLLLSQCQVSILFKEYLYNESQIKLRYLSCFGCAGAGKSSKSASKFGIDDLTNVKSARKKTPAASPTASAPKAPIRGKGGKKRKASKAEDLQGLPLLRQQFLDYVNEVRITAPVCVSFGVLGLLVSDVMPCLPCRNLLR